MPQGHSSKGDRIYDWACSCALSVSSKKISIYIAHINSKEVIVHHLRLKTNFLNAQNT